MGVALPQIPLDKGNCAYEVGVVGVVQQVHKTSGECISRQPYVCEAEAQVTLRNKRLAKPPPPPPPTKKTPYTSRIQGWGISTNPHLEKTNPHLGDGDEQKEKERGE